VRRFEGIAREFLSDWRFWTGVAYFGIVCTIVALFVLFNRTAREDAYRVASTRAAATAQVVTCFASSKTAPVVRGFLTAHEVVIENSLIANQAALKLLGPRDPLYPILADSIVRLDEAKANAHDLIRLFGKTTPTRTSCTQLAHRLNVTVPGS
jgi:hypothetical protein